MMAAIEVIKTSPITSHPSLFMPAATNKPLEGYRLAVPTSRKRYRRESGDLSGLCPAMAMNRRYPTGWLRSEGGHAVNAGGVAGYDPKPSKMQPTD